MAAPSRHGPPRLSSARSSQHERAARRRARPRLRPVDGRDNDEGWWNRSPQFRFTNRNKRGLALNLKDPEGQRVIRELAAHCDVVVENFRRGVLDRAGLGYEALKAINPRIVFAAISSQGDTGPERMNISFGSTLDATSGIASLTGYEGEEPRRSRPSWRPAAAARGRSSTSPSARSPPSPWARRF
jgi:crotonobetainyl-CoA:carnitine CoA-transferase CaiB-like acyl-CoA transferase